MPHKRRSRLSFLSKRSSIDGGGGSSNGAGAKKTQSLPLHHGDASASPQEHTMLTTQINIPDLQREEQKKLTAEIVEREVAIRDQSRRARLGEALAMVDVRFDAANKTTMRTLTESRKAYTLSGRALGLGVLVALCGPMAAHAHEPAELLELKTLMDALLVSLPMVCALLAVHFQLESIRAEAKQAQENEVRSVTADMASLGLTIKEARSVLMAEESDSLQFLHQKKKKKEKHHRKMPHLPTSLSLRRLNRSGSKHVGSGRRGLENIMEEEHDSKATPGWKKFVRINLPEERAYEMTEEEASFADKISANTKGKWNQLGGEHQLMLLRGYKGKKDRMKLSVEGVNDIVEWRAKYDCDNLLTVECPSHAEYYESWTTKYSTKEDRYGHPIIYDRNQDFDLDTLYSNPHEDF